MNENLNKILRHPAVAPAFAGAICFGIGYALGKKNRIVARTIPSKTDIWEGRAVDPFDMPHEDPIGRINWVTPDGSPVGEDDISRIFKQLKDEEQPAKVIFVENDDNPLYTGVKVDSFENGFVVSGTNYEKVKETQVETMVNEDGDGLTVFESTDEVWVWETEIAGRTTLEPYILHKDEFYGEETEDYTQTTLTYYAGDDILVDQDDKPVYNYHSVVGPLRFGHGSDQEGVFYVRNDKLKAEYEVVHDDGLYSVEVLGLEIEENDRVKGLKHSVPRFRPE